MLKELADNALDAGATVRVGQLEDGGWFVEDDGPGIAGDPADIARLQQLSASLTAEAGRSITQIDVLKGLLRMGEGADKRKLLAHIKDAYFEPS